MTYGVERLAVGMGPDHGPAQATAQVISLSELHGDTVHQKPQPARVLDNANPLHSVRTTLQVCVGEVEVSIGELMGAREHQVLVLDRTVDQPVDLVLNGKVVARGQLMAVEGNFALRITELPVSLNS